MSKPYIKITFQDIEIAEEFFNNEKHLEEFLINVMRYYRGLDLKIKTRIVEKYFKTYKKTMDFIINSKQFGEKGAQKKLENQQVDTNTLEGSLEGMLEGTLPTNNKYKIENKEIIPESNSGDLFTEVNSSKKASTSRKKPKEESPLYTRIVSHWFEIVHDDWTFQKIDGTKVNSIIKKLNALFVKHNREVTDNSVFDFFKLMCDNLPEYYKDKSLRIIDSDFYTIIEQLKKPKNGQQTTVNNKPKSRYSPVA